MRNQITSVALLATFSLSACTSKGLTPPDTKTSSPSGKSASVGHETRFRILVDASGYHPERVEAKAGEPLVLAFERSSDEGCGQELVFPDHNIRRKLPPSEEVLVRITPAKTTPIRFTCGMGMYKGSVILDQ